MMVERLTSGAMRPYGAEVTPTTTTRWVVEKLLDDAGEGPLGLWVVSRRSAGQSWRSIASELGGHTAPICSVSHQTLRAWFAEVEPTTPLDMTP